MEGNHGNVEDSQTHGIQESVNYSEDFETTDATSATVYSEDFETISRATTRDETEYTTPSTQGTSNPSEGYSESSLDSDMPTTQLNSSRPASRSKSVVYSDTFVSQYTISDEDTETEAGSSTTSMRSGSSEFIWDDDDRDSVIYSESAKKIKLDTTSGRKNQKPDSEATKAAEQKYIAMKLNLLKGHCDRPTCDSRSSLQNQDESIKPPDNLQETRYMKKFIKHKLKLLCKINKNCTQKETETFTSPPHAYKQLGLSPLSDGDPVEKHGVASSRVHMLQLKNSINRMKIAAKTDIHEPRKCRDCIEQNKRLAEKCFVRRKTAQLDSKLLEVKLEERHIFCNDRVGLMGKALRDLPSLKSDLDTAMDQLLAPLAAQSSQKHS